METIEERAREYADKHYPHKYNGSMEVYANGISRLVYADAAKEQKQIDIDRACEWLSQCESLQMRPYNIELFRKAMEGE